MRIIVATSAPTFWQPQAECLAQAMRRHGHDAEVLTPAGNDGSIRHSCDALVCIGSGESLRPFLDAVNANAKILFLIESIPTPTEEDGFTRSKLAIHQEYLTEFGCVFVHSPRSISAMKSLGLPRVEALIWPHFPSIFHPAPNSERDLDVLFVGTMSPHRKMVLDRAAGRFNVAFHTGVFHANLAALYGRAKIALNVHFTALRNFECRVVEALGCGTFLLTERLDPDDLLLDGEHLAVFDQDNLLDVMERYLHDAEERERIAQAGNTEIQKYSVEIQVERILEEAAALVHAPCRPQTKSADDGSRSPPKVRWHPESRKAADLIGGPPSGVSAKPVGASAAGEILTSGMRPNQATVTMDNKSYTIAYPETQTIDYMLNEVFVRKVYPFFSFLRSTTGVILDIGANIGCTVILFRAHYPDAPIFAFEPDRETFQYLKANTSLLTNVHLSNFGLFDREGVARLYKGKGTSTTNSLAKSRHNTDKHEEIRLRRFSSFVAEHQISRISLLKIDTEGAEVPLLRDIEHLLDRVDAISLEYHSERDRLEIDHLLSRQFVLCHANVTLAHRGTVSYASKATIAGQTNFDDLEIARPVF